RRDISVDAGDEEAGEANTAPTSEPLKARGLCLGLPADSKGLVAKLQESIDLETGAILIKASLRCGTPKFEEPGYLTRRQSSWKIDE
ncbi:unnamed protein product, partial [Laminaria digitata]